MNHETLLVLLSWAAHLTGYPTQPLPEMRYVDHQFLVNNACYGKPCGVIGWYNDTGVVYIDDRYTVDDSGFAASFIVHEFVHYLQHKSGHWDMSTSTCEKRIQREREAYHIQNQYILQAHDQTQRIQPKPTWCKYE